MDERRALEVLDSRGAAPGECGITAHGAAGEHADERPVALASVLGKGAERRIEIALEVIGLRLALKKREQIFV